MAEIRRLVWERDNRRCVRGVQVGIDRELPLAEAHIDHVVNGKRGNNKLGDLRTLCRFHRVLRADGRRGGRAATVVARFLPTVAGNEGTDR